MRNDHYLYTFDFNIKINGESGKQVKSKISQRLRQSSSDNYLSNSFIIDRFDLELNDPLYIFIDEYARQYFYFLPDSPGYPYKSKKRSFERWKNGDAPRIWIANFRQREGSLEATFELIVETAVYYGALRAVVEYLVSDLESIIGRHAGERVKIDVRERSTRIKFKGTGRKFKIRNWIFRLSTTVALIILAYAIVKSKSSYPPPVDREEIIRIVTQTVKKVSEEQRQIASDSTMIKIDSIK